MADQLSVRRVTASDREQWLALWGGWQRHMSGRVPETVTEMTWARLLDPGSGLMSLLAWKHGKALGFANVSLTPFAWTGSDIMFLQDFYVQPEHRGQGAGSALLKAAYDLADERRASQVFWMVDETDAELQAFYQRHAVRTPYLRFMRKTWDW